MLQIHPDVPYRSIQHKHQPLAGSGISTLIHQLHSIISFSSLIDVRDILSGERGCVCYRFVRFSTCSNYSFRLKSAKTRNMWLVLIQSITLNFFSPSFFQSTYIYFAPKSLMRPMFTLYNRQQKNNMFMLVFMHRYAKMRSFHASENLLISK